MQGRETDQQDRVWERLAQSRLTIDQTDSLLEMDRAEIEAFYSPIARLLLERRRALNRRILAAVAGPPGVGKTAFTTLLVAVIAVTGEAAVAGVDAGQNVAVQIQQDGWHYPNAYLAAHTLQRGNEKILLSLIKGVPETFDAAAS